jgi:ABC-type arginine transport system ATPase subunit
VTGHLAQLEDGQICRAGLEFEIVEYDTICLLGGSREQESKQGRAVEGWELSRSGRYSIAQRVYALEKSMVV